MITTSYSLSDNILRIIIIGFLIVLLIIARLVQLQIQESDIFFTRSQKNFLKIESVPPLRGNIIAHDGTLLATNRPVINVYWQGTGSCQLHENNKKILIHWKNYSVYRYWIIMHLGMLFITHNVIIKKRYLPKISRLLN